MKTATFDNPASMARECWQDGQLICSYDFKLFYIEPFPVPPKKFHMGANIGDWVCGQIVGDKEAIRSKE